MRKNIYKIEPAWLLKECLKLMIILIANGWCFYDQFIYGIVSMPMLIYVFVCDLRAMRNRKIENNKATFNELLQCVDTNLSAGYSLEKAFLAAYEEQVINREGVRTIGREMRRELNKVAYGLNCNQDICRLLVNMGNTLLIQDIEEFSKVLELAKVHGGNMISLIRSFNSTVTQKRKLADEVDTLISGKKLEGRIMICMPYLIIAYMRLTSPNYLNVLYDTSLGRLAMTIALLVVLVALYATDKIVASTGAYGN